MTLFFSLTTNTPMHIRMMTTHQPWASLIADGVKRYETGVMAPGYLGTIGIYASTATIRACDHALMDGPIGEAAREAGASTGASSCYVVGAVIGIATITDVMTADQAIEQMDPERLPLETHFGSFDLGRYAWVLEDARRLETPVPCHPASGARIWFPDGALVDEVMRQVPQPTPPTPTPRRSAA